MQHEYRTLHLIVLCLTLKFFRFLFVFKILSEATRKLCLVRRAERLFDDNGCEIFKSEDILRDKDYYVSCGENYISSIRAVRRM